MGPYPHTPMGSWVGLRASVLALQLFNRHTCVWNLIEPTFVYHINPPTSSYTYIYIGWVLLPIMPVRVLVRQGLHEVCTYVPIKPTIIILIYQLKPPYLY
jgi:hypothetical protein